ncbi:MAG TPA: sulfatase [Candidatus Polarisedimenticolia bacterium]|nr:sulfatase [Candidatus Polarisedimenticolia bacterium]
MISPRETGGSMVSGHCPGAPPEVSRTAALRGCRRDAAGTRPARLAAVLGSAVLALLLLPACARHTRPNILLIVIDTARADRFSWGGATRVVAPRLEALAQEATVYTDAWSPAPWTVPAHASLFTGRYPSAHGTDCGALRLPDAETTLAEILRDAGYRTAGYTANPWLGATYNFQQGFDTWGETWREVPQGSPDTGATLNNERLERFLRWYASNPDARRQPFFLFANYFEPHLPYHPPQPERSRMLPPGLDEDQVEALSHLGHPAEMAYILDRSNLPPQDLAILRGLYDGEIAYVDRRLGEIVDLLRALDLLDDTVLVVAGDHGENLGEHHMLDHKMSVHATLLKVPLLVRYPKAFARGRRETKPVQLHDLFPTLLALAGAAPPSGTVVEAVPLPDAAGRGGRDPKAPIVGEFAGPPVDFLKVMAESFPGADLERFDRTLVSFHRGSRTIHWGSDGKHALYDTAADPGETRDLAPSDPAGTKALAAEVDAWLHRPARAARSPSGRP